MKVLRSPLKILPDDVLNALVEVSDQESGSLLF